MLVTYAARPSSARTVQETDRETLFFPPVSALTSTLCHFRLSLCCEHFSGFSKTQDAVTVIVMQPVSLHVGRRVQEREVTGPEVTNRERSTLPGMFAFCGNNRLSDVG